MNTGAVVIGDLEEKRNYAARRKLGAEGKLRARTLAWEERDGFRGGEREGQKPHS